MAQGTELLKKLERMNKVVRGLRGKTVRVGVFSTAQHPSGGGTVAEVAVKNHFGFGNTPARPIITTEVLTDPAVTASFVLGYKSNLSADAILTRVGERAVEAVKERIRNRIPPPNRPSTIARKGSDIPLIDTETLINSIEYKVEPT